MIKIFSFDKTVCLIDKQSAFKPSAGAILLSTKSANETRTNYEQLINQKNLKEIYFFDENLQLLFNNFSAMFRVIEAAGGLVKNKKGEGLFIFRNGKWDLPKGKIEKGEGIKTAAIREVEEECGINELSITKELSPTYHTYLMEEKNILKKTYWFEMFSDDTSPLIPQTEEGITKVKWIALNDLQQVFDNTYESVVEVIKNGTE